MYNIFTFDKDWLKRKNFCIRLIFQYTWNIIFELGLYSNIRILESKYFNITFTICGTSEISVEKSLRVKTSFRVPWLK